MKKEQGVLQKTFVCENCGFLVKEGGNIGTKNRNHCPKCLYSKHLDNKIAGDRDSVCKGIMRPVGITFKKLKNDKYGNKRVGELMIIHKCKKCEKIVKNRIAGDDSNDKILKLCKNDNDLEKVKTQLYGKLKN